jgi:hypothetical protein
VGPQPSKTQKKCCYYRWEFLRRNPEYRRDYKEFVKLCKKEGWDPETKPLQLEHWEKPDKQRRLKYGVVLLENPTKKIPLDKIEENPFWPYFEDKGFKRPRWRSFLNPLYPKGEPVIIASRGSSDDEVEAPLNLIINLTFPKTEIMARVKKLVEDAIEERKKVGLHVYRSRKRFDLYDQYLKIWDLRKRGLTYKEIAAKVYPKEPLEYVSEQESDAEEHDKRVKELIASGKPGREAYSIADKEYRVGGKRNPVIQKVIDQYIEADRLVNGGYLEIR